MGKPRKGHRRARPPAGPLMFPRGNRARAPVLAAKSRGAGGALLELPAGGSRGGHGAGADRIPEARADSPGRCHPGPPAGRCTRLPCGPRGGVSGDPGQLSRGRRNVNVWPRPSLSFGGYGCASKFRPGHQAVKPPLSPVSLSAVLHPRDS